MERLIGGFLHVLSPASSLSRIPTALPQLLVVDHTFDSFAYVLYPRDVLFADWSFLEVSVALV